jgi:hypothetical protein
MGCRHQQHGKIALLIVDQYAASDVDAAMDIR